MDVVDTHPRHRASVALRRLLGEVWILVAEPVVLVILGTAIALCAAVGFINAATSHEVQPALTSIQTQLDEVAAAQRRGEVEIDGSLLEPLQRSLEAVRERAELDLHYGSLLGVAEAILGLLTTGLGAAMGVTIGAVTVGRDFERRTWFHELVNAPSRRSAIANKAVAGLGLMVMVAVIGSITAVGAALLAHIVLGGLVVGTVRAVLIPQAIVFLLSATLWVLLGFVGALVCRSGGNAATAGFVVLADAAISLNLSR